MAKAFKSLSVGEVFYFAKHSSGMAQGPWTKTGSRKYSGGGYEHRIGSINVKTIYPGEEQEDIITGRKTKMNPRRKRSRRNPASKDLKIKLISGTEKQLKNLLRKAGYAVGTLTNPDPMGLVYAPGIAEGIERGAQGLLRRKRKNTKRRKRILPPRRRKR